MAAQYFDQIVNLTEEEAKKIIAKAEAAGVTPEIYLKVRGLAADQLPDPAAFFALFARIDTFVKGYRACLQSLSRFETGAANQIPPLGAQFAQILQEWDELYGPRP